MTMYRILGKRGRITIPFEIRQRVGFSYNAVLSAQEQRLQMTDSVTQDRSEPAEDEAPAFEQNM